MTPPLECPLCGPSPARRVWRQAGFTIVRCRRCRLLVTWPRPSAHELSAFYDRAAYYDEQGMGAQAAEAWVERAREILERVPVPVARALDMGAGEGHAVAALRTLGVQADGVEPSPAARARARALHGLELVPALEAYVGSACDLVTLIHSLEHVPDPVATLRAVTTCLRPGGVVFIEVPHAGSAELLTRHGRELILQLPAHLYHFTPTTLRRVVERAGLEVNAVYESNPALLERLFARRARRGAARARPSRTPNPAPTPVTRTTPARAGWRRVWAAHVLPWLRAHFPGYKFQIVARRPPDEHAHLHAARSE